MTKPSLAATPPMGWNSWNCFRTDICERDLTEIAQVLVDTGLLAAGYEYFVVDDGWQASTRDDQGRLVADRTRFPGGMAALGEAVHRLGFQFGMYASPGRQTCAMIYDAYPGEGLGSYTHERLDLHTFADWGADFLKYDWCEADRGETGLTYRGAFSHMAAEIAALDRPMLYSISEYGRTQPWQWAATHAHMWRTTPDIEPSWASFTSIVDNQHGLAGCSGPGGWNDPDMLQIGNQGLSDIEGRTHMMLWCLLAAPLMAGNDPRTMTEATRQTLTHPGLVALDQDRWGRPGSRIGRASQWDLWQRTTSSGLVLGLLNTSESTLRLPVRDGALLSPDGAQPLLTWQGDATLIWEAEPLPTDGMLEIPSHAMTLLDTPPQRTTWTS